MAGGHARTRDDDRFGRISNHTGEPRQRGLLIRGTRRDGLCREHGGEQRDDALRRE